jgi:hypothetical protein
MYMNDEGVKLEVVFDDLSDVSTAKLKYRKPDETIGSWDCTIDGNSIYYITEANDIDQVGVWELQPYLEFSSGFKGNGDIVKMKVLKAI